MINKKYVFSAIGILLVSSLVYGSLAWFSDSETTPNYFQAGKVDIDLRENEDGNTTGIKVDGIVAGTTIDKRIDVRIPKGTSKCLLRIEFVQTLLKNNNLVIDTDEDFSNGVDGYSEFRPVFADNFQNYWIQDLNNKNVYYYYKVVDAKESEVITEQILKSVEITGKAGNEYQGLDYTIDVKADAIQATNEAYKEWIQNTPYRDGKKANENIENLLKNITKDIENS